jgi:hypothetical protein
MAELFLELQLQIFQVVFELRESRTPGLFPFCPSAHSSCSILFSPSLQYPARRGIAHICSLTEITCQFCPHEPFCWLALYFVTRTPWGCAHGEPNPPAEAPSQIARSFLRQVGLRACGQSIFLFFFWPQRVVKRWGNLSWGGGRTRPENAL